ncbi:uncharacterized protein ATNIH1004_004876 [Aspergillus tanneri]|uniref:Uncharacterized protein n=1 Tax=Aspergillus tanneri TaxID=1220188 RepID=A0A5M9MSU2_9EURO|nr:uncharacterized protein ATNIH1004_004876 [Aspergillus tanneri]KAA8648986.1 hypothetical protein ATNIH1004_004876 [Aspergillus tanneri]
MGSWEIPDECYQRARIDLQRGIYSIHKAEAEISGGDWGVFWAVFPTVVPEEEHDAFFCADVLEQLNPIPEQHLRLFIVVLSGRTLRGLRVCLSVFVGLENILEK